MQIVYSDRDDDYYDRRAGRRRKGNTCRHSGRQIPLAYFDTGMVYRAVGLEMRRKGLDRHDENAAEAIARELTFPKMIELSKDPEFRSSEGGGCRFRRLCTSQSPGRSA